MKAVLVKDTNEVLGFPDTMADDDIDLAIKSDVSGRPNVDVNPNFYDTTVRPALEQAKATGNDRILYDAQVRAPFQDPFIKSLVSGATFGATPNNDQETKTVNPISDFLGNIIGQTAAILGIAKVTAPVIGPISTRLGLVARGATPIEIRAAQIGSGEVLPKLAGEAISKTVQSSVGASAVGMLYNGIVSSIDEGKKEFDLSEETAPDLAKIGHEILKGATWGVYGLGGSFAKTPVGISAGTAAVAGTAYVMSKAEGASEPDAQLNSVVMGIVHLASHADLTVPQRKAAITTLKDSLADYVKEKNGMTEVNNMHQLTADEFVYSNAKELLRQKYIAQLEAFNNDPRRIAIGEQADALRQKQAKELQDEIDMFNNELPRLDDEGGQYAIDKIAENPVDTQELVRRIADEVFQVKEAKNAKGTGTEIKPGNAEEGAIGKEEASVRLRNANETGVEAGTQEIKPKVQRVKVSTEQLPVGEGEKKASALEARIKEKLATVDETQKNLISNYKEMNKKDQMKAAAEFVIEKGADEAIAVLKGEKPAPKGLLHNSIALALEEHATFANDADLAIKLASLRSTRAGQEISILTERDADSPVRYIQELQQRRIEALTQGKKTVQEVTKAEVKKVKEAIKKPSKEDWSSFINSIKC